MVLEGLSNMGGLKSRLSGESKHLVFERVILVLRNVFIVFREATFGPWEGVSNLLFERLTSRLSGNSG